jgi:dTDP-4-dehydrorhamnose reductase
MKVLLFGASGMLGQDIFRVLKQEGHILDAPTEAEVDITVSDMVEGRTVSFCPDIVIHAAAYTNVDACEENRDIAMEVNATGTKNVALAAKKSEAYLIYICTDYVFDGRSKNPYKENCPTSPLSVYGLSKLRGEEYVSAIMRRYCIVRTSWLFGKGGKNFVYTMLKLSDDRDVIRVVDDQVGSPTYTVDLARALGYLAVNPYEGILHVTNTGYCSWFQFAKKIFEFAGKNNILVVPISSEELCRPAKRPAFSGLDGSRAKTFGITMQKWEDALREYLNVICL